VGRVATPDASSARLCRCPSCVHAGRSAVTHEGPRGGAPSDACSHRCSGVRPHDPVRDLTDGFVISDRREPDARPGYRHSGARRLGSRPGISSARYCMSQYGTSVMANARCRRVLLGHPRAEPRAVSRGLGAGSRRSTFAYRRAAATACALVSSLRAFSMSPGTSPGWCLGAARGRRRTTRGGCRIAIEAGSFDRPPGWPRACADKLLGLAGVRQLRGPVDGRQRHFPCHP
jgi:hypothetical protein